MNNLCSVYKEQNIEMVHWLLSCSDLLINGIQLKFNAPAYRNDPKFSDR